MEEINIEEKAKDVIAADIRLISGCEDVQTSADVSDVDQFKLPDPAGRAGGACTSGLLQVLYADHHDSSADLTFEDVLLKLRDNLNAMGLSQVRKEGDEATQQRT
jgi:metacaspase-1